jgi:quinol monooxygenase YgiN
MSAARRHRLICANTVDFDAHNATPYFKDWSGKLPDLAEVDVKVMQKEVLAKSQ